MFSSHFNISLMAAALTLTGCMSQQIANTKHMDDAALKQAANSTQTPQQVCEAASVAISQANKEELHFFAPLHLEQASDNLEDGQDQIKVKETEAEGVKKCFKVNKLVENGIAIKAKVKISLSDSLAELEMLKKVDSQKRFTDDIHDFVDDTQDLVEKIEAGKMNEAMQGQAELLKEMLELEIEIVTDKNLTPVEVMIEKAEDVDADDLAEKTFEKAEVELESAKKFIRANYRDDAQVEATSALAMRAAKHAFHVAKEVETLKELKPEAAEEKVLYIESLFERINKQFDRDVIIGHSLYEQSTILSQRLTALIDNNGLTSQAVAEKLPAEETVKPVVLDQVQTETESSAIESVSNETKADEAVTTESVATEIVADATLAAEIKEFEATLVPEASTEVAIEDTQLVAVDESTEAEVSDGVVEKVDSTEAVD